MQENKIQINKQNSAKYELIDLKNKEIKNSIYSFKIEINDRTLLKERKK